jgi:hypothetical protein
VALDLDVEDLVVEVDVPEGQRRQLAPAKAADQRQRPGGVEAVLRGVAQEGRRLDRGEGALAAVLGGAHAGVRV